VGGVSRNDSGCRAFCSISPLRQQLEQHPARDINRFDFPRAHQLHVAERNLEHEAGSNVAISRKRKTSDDALRHRRRY
jgi:hypothetical protein